MIFLHEDPERAWAELDKHILWEAVTYGSWIDGVPLSSMHLPGVQTLEAVRASGRYRFLTPNELVREANADPRLWGDGLSSVGRWHADRRGVEVSAAVHR